MGYFDNNEKTEEKRNEAKMQYGLGIIDEADAFVEEYLEESLREGAQNGKRLIDSSFKTKDGKSVTCCLPEFASYSGAYVAWLISEKGLSVDEALKSANPRNDDAEKLASEFNTFVMERSLLMDESGRLHTYDAKTNEFVSPDRANDMKTVFARAAKKLEEYKLPEIDYSDPKAVKENAENLAFLKAFGKEIMSQASVKGYDPYKISSENTKVKKAFADAIAKEIVSNPIDVFNTEYGTNDYKNGIENIESTVNGLNKYFGCIKNCYSRDTWHEYPEHLLAERHLLNDINGKTPSAAGKILKDISIHTQDTAKILSFEFGISEKRIDDRLKGAEDSKLDEAVKTAVSINEGTLRSKVRSRIKKMDKDGYRSRYLKNQSKDNVDTDFKMMSELKGEIIEAEIDAVLKKNKDTHELDDTSVMMLEKMKSSISTIRRTAIEAEKKEDYYMFRGAKPIKDTYLPLHGTSYPGENATDDKDISSFRNMQEGLGELVQVLDTMDLQDTPFPESVEKIKEQARSIANADGHFLDSLLYQQVTQISLPQAKKMYSRAYPTYKNDRMRLKSIIEDKTQKLDKENDERISMDDLKGADKEIAKLYKTEKRASDQLEIKVNVKKMIERVQSRIKGSEDMTYDQFTDILAARAAVNAKRNNVKGLDKEASSIKIANLKDEIGRSQLIRQFYADAKNDPKKWEELLKSAKKGHAGELEDKIKTYSNTVPIRNIATDPVNERFITTPKERIEAWQNEAKNNPNSSKIRLASEILIMRNIAESKAGSKSSLDKPITTEMLEEARKQDKILREDSCISSMINDMEVITRDKVLFEGHGGKLIEYLRFKGESYKYDKYPGTKEILEQNTIVGKYKLVDKKFAACEKATRELYQQVLDKKFTKASFDKQINDYFPRLVAESVVASDIIDKVKETDGKQSGLRVDMDQKAFEKKVNALMATDEFKANYKTMMSAKNMPKKFDAKTMSEKYKEAKVENKQAAEIAKNKEKFVKELEEKMKHVGPIMN